MGNLINLSGKRVLITGISGFKGNWLAVMLHELGALVYGYGLEPEHITALSSDDLSEIGVFQNGDIKDKLLFETFVHYVKPDVIIHMAAQPLVKKSYSHPYETLETNIMGTLSILEAVRKCDAIHALLFISSDRCSLNSRIHYTMPEINSSIVQSDPYTASKTCGEIIHTCYGTSYFTQCRYCTARSGNIIGGGDWSKDRIIPQLIRSLRNNNAINIYTPLATRSWLHVLDVLYGYLLLIEHMLSRNVSGSFNFGPPLDHVMTIKELASQIVNIWGDGTIHIDTINQKHVENNIHPIDSTRAQFDLGWKQKIPILKALEITIEWYKEFFNGKKAIDIIKEQTKEYIMLHRSLH